MKLGLPHIGWLERLRTERRQYFDEQVDGELWDLLEAAALLEIKEYALFEIAYKDWYGHNALSNVMETHFNNYMFNGVIPGWVARYCRKVIELERHGELDLHALGIYKPQPSRRLILIGKWYAVGLLLMFLLVTYFSLRDSFSTSSLFGRADFERPPHYNAMP